MKGAASLADHSIVKILSQQVSCHSNHLNQKLTIDSVELRLANLVPITRIANRVPLAIPTHQNLTRESLCDETYEVPCEAASHSPRSRSPPSPQSDYMADI